MPAPKSLKWAKVPGQKVEPPTTVIGGIPEAPNNTLIQGRRGSTQDWIPVPVQIEAPNNTTLHGRRGSDNTWQPLAPAGIGDAAPTPNILWCRRGDLQLWQPSPIQSDAPNLPANQLWVRRGTDNTWQPLPPGADVDKAYVDAQDLLRVLKAGDTMTGELTIAPPSGGARLRINSNAVSSVELRGDTGSTFDLVLLDGSVFSLALASGPATFLFTAGANIIFQVAFADRIVNFVFPPRTAAVPVNPNDLTNKAYVDSRPRDLPPGGTTGQILAKRSNTDFDVEWIAARVFIGTSVVTELGTEAAGAIVGTLTIPPAELPNTPFYWVCEGTGLGHLFSINARDRTGVITNCPRHVEVLDGGTWINAGSHGATEAALPIPPPRMLVRGNGTNRLYHYDPAIDTAGIQVRAVITGPTPLPTTACTYTFGLEGQILQFA